MESFRSIVKDLDWDWKLHHPSKQLLLGSCFSENIGSRLSNSGFDCDINPFGIIYHPLVIARLLERLIDGKEYLEQELDKNGDRFLSFVA